MAANHGDAKTSNQPSRSSQGATTGLALRYASTFSGPSCRCGRSDPGTAATARRNSSTSAVRMLVSCRHERRTTATITMRTAGQFVPA